MKVITKIVSGNLAYQVAYTDCKEAQEEFIRLVNGEFDKPQLLSPRQEDFFNPNFSVHIRTFQVTI